MHLLQVCNVGDICGGTAACAWSVTRALPNVRHSVLFLSPATPQTRAAFQAVILRQGPRIDNGVLSALRPDVILLHNIAATKVALSGLLPPVFQYIHSEGSRAPADLTLACSHWLAGRLKSSGHRPPDAVLHQAAPRPVPSKRACHRALRDRPRIGRLCTPTGRKWPDALVPFYRRLARLFPCVEWEFVGCPSAMQPVLRDACAGRATFHAAAWSARSRLWEWDAQLYHHPTLTESFGRTVADSLRAGCIPIVDRRGGFVEQLEPRPAVGRLPARYDELAGFLCNTVDDFAAAVDALHVADRRRTLSRAAQKLGDGRFSLERFGRDLWSCFRACC